jgi:hypothetical protein
MDKQSKMQLRRDAGYRSLPVKQEKVLGPEYAMSFACFTCKTAHKRHFDGAPCDYPNTMECPICKNTTFNLGRHFKAPKKSDSAQWKKVEFLVDHGFLFQKIRLDKNGYESVPYPDTLAEAKEFVEKYKQYAIK